jgi:hypothetical protein
MKRYIPILILLFLVSLSLACEATSDVFEESTPTTAPLRTKRPTRTPVPPSPTPIPISTNANCPNGECITACVNKLDSIVSRKNKKAPRHEFDQDEEYTLVTYDIEGNEITNPERGKIISSLKSYQNDTKAQQQLWDYFAAIIPSEQRLFLTHYLVFTDGEENLLASVAQSQDNAAEWDLSVDIVDTNNPKDLTFTLVHEFGHLLTLNPNQVPPNKAIFNNPDSDSIYNKAKKACKNYFPGEGCAEENSYINQFFQRFWDNKLYEEWLKVSGTEDPDAFDAKLERFYKKYKDRFVTDYAPTSPEEDIAESWTFFVLKPKPGSKTIANQKVLFFYEFPELIHLREQIAVNLCNQLEK